VVAGRRRQRQRRVHDRPQPPGGDVAEHGQERGLAAHRRAQDLDLAEEDVAQIDRRGEAGGRAAGDDPAAVAHRADRLLEHLAADVLDHDIDAALAGERARHLGEVGAAVVDRDVGAQPARRRELVVAADRRDHQGAVQLGDLDRRDPDARAAALHQHRRARADLALLDHHLPRGETAGSPPPPRPTAARRGRARRWPAGSRCSA
jgi:hypothetical protein